MERASYWIYRLVHKFRRWILRRFTHAGIFLAVLLAVAAFMGFDTTLAMVYQIFTLLAAVLLLSFLFSRKFRVKFGVRRHLPRFVTAGQRFVYDVSIESHNKRAQKDLFVLEEFESSLPTYREFSQTMRAVRPQKSLSARKMGLNHWSGLLEKKQGAHRQRGPLFSLQPRETKSVRLEMLPVRRGRIRLSGITVARPDPLGLCYARRFLGPAQSILVLPKRYSLPPINLPGGRKHHSGGIALTTSVGESEEFVSLRDYRPGDSLRRFHWKSWAKTGKPIVKEYQEEYFVRHVLILDTFVGEAHSDAFEEAISLAASFACTVQTQESLLDLIFVGLEVYCFTSGRGLGQMDKILEVLADVRPCEDKPFEALFPTVLSRAEFCSGCICIFLSWDEKRQKLVNLLRQMNLPVFVLVVLEPDDSAMLDPGPMSDVSEYFHVLRAGEIERGLGQI